MAPARAQEVVAALRARPGDAASAAVRCAAALSVRWCPRLAPEMEDGAGGLRPDLADLCLWIVYCVASCLDGCGWWLRAVPSALAVLPWRTKAAIFPWPSGRCSSGCLPSSVQGRCAVTFWSRRLRCCGGGGVTHHRQCASIWWGGLDMCDTDENHALLRTVLAATAPAGLDSLLGGVAKVCQHLFLLAWVVVSRRKPIRYRTGDGGV